MAQRRMFSKQIIDSDAFLDMPLSTQALYFHLSMRADDDGFTNNPSKILRVIGGAKNDLDLLLAKNFLIGFETGVVVIKHWLIHNYIRKDRYSPTPYTDEKAQLSVKDNDSYTLGQPDDNQRSTNGRRSIGEVRLGEVSIVEDSKDKEEVVPKVTPVSHRFTKPTIQELKEYCLERKNEVDAEQFFNYYESNGWKVGRNSMKDWKSAVRTWERNNKQFAKTQTVKAEPDWMKDYVKDLESMEA